MIGSWTKKIKGRVKAFIRIRFQLLRVSLTAQKMQQMRHVLSIGGLEDGPDDLGRARLLSVLFHFLTDTGSFTF